jgi:hypothetical protein
MRFRFASTRHGNVCEVDGFLLAASSQFILRNTIFREPFRSHSVYYPRTGQAGAQKSHPEKRVELSDVYETAIKSTRMDARWEYLRR